MKRVLLISCFLLLAAIAVCAVDDYPKFDGFFGYSFARASGDWGGVEPGGFTPARSFCSVKPDNF